MSDDALLPYKELILKLAVFYEYADRLDSGALHFQAEVLSQWTIAEVSAASLAYVKDLRNERFPRPIHSVMKYLYPELSDRDKATVSSTKIWAAIARYGRYRSDDARSDLGEDLWQVVTLYGGWTKVCEQANQQDPGIFKAQLRDLTSGITTQNRATQIKDSLQDNSTKTNLLGFLKEMPKVESHE